MKILFVTSEFGSNGGGLSLSSERVFNYCMWILLVISYL